MKINLGKIIKSAIIPMALHNSSIKTVLQALQQYESSNEVLKILESCDSINDEDWSDYEALITALNLEDKQIVMSLLNKNCRITGDLSETPEAIDWTLPLHSAILMDDPEIVQALLQKGASLYDECSGKTIFELAIETASDSILNVIFSFDTRGFSKLHYACLKNDLTAVEVALKTNDFINSTVSHDSPRWQGFTPLHLAVIHNHLNITKLLLNHGADISIQDVENMTPLHYAISKRYEKIIKFILSILIPKNINVIDTYGLSLLHIACMLRDFSFVKDLLQLKQDSRVNACVSSDSPLWPDFTPLHVAAKYNRLEIAKLLLSHGANIKAATSTDGKTPLHVAHYYGNKNMMDLILSADDGTCNPADGKRLSHFHIACSRRDSAIVERFLKHHGEKLLRRGGKYRPRAVWAGLTPLLIAARYNRTNVIKVLLNYGEDLDELQAVRFCVLNNRCHRMMDHLIAEGVYDPDDWPFIAPKGHTLLQYACEVGRVGLARVLLKRNVDPNFYVRLLTTPLQLAILNRHEKIIKLLLDHGADPYGTTRVHELNALDELVSTVVMRKDDTREKLERYYYRVIMWLIEAGMESSDVNRALRRSTINNVAAWALLQCGADINAVGRNGKTALWHYFGGSSCFGDNLVTYGVFRNHLQKLRTVALPICLENQALFLAMRARYEHQYKRTEKIDLSSKCEEEAEKIYKTKFNKYTSLLDVLFKNPDEMAILVSNDALRKILEADDFEEKYPMYGFLLKLQFKRGSLRRPLLEYAQDSLQAITGRSLPDSCIMEIFKYLSDKTLRNLTKAKDVVTSKQQD